MSYPISGLVKSYKAKQYEVEHPLVVGHLKVIIFYAKQRTVLAQVPTAGLLSCLRVKAGKFKLFADDYRTGGRSFSTTVLFRTTFTRTIMLNLL